MALKTEDVTDLVRSMADANLDVPNFDDPPHDQLAFARCVLARYVTEVTA